MTSLATVKSILRCVYTVQLIVCLTNFTENLNSVHTYVGAINQCQPELLFCDSDSDSDSDSATEFMIVLFNGNNSDQSDRFEYAYFLFTKLLLRNELTSSEITDLELSKR